MFQQALKVVPWVDAGEALGVEVAKHARRPHQPKEAECSGDQGADQKEQARRLIGALALHEVAQHSPGEEGGDPR